MPSPTVSVIVPCYNQGAFLPDAVSSVQAQTVRDWECLVINDGSTDNTAAVARSLVERDSRIRYIEHTNLGLSATRNRGLDLASGRFIQFLDADDVIKPEKFRLQIRAIASEGRIVVAYCDYYRSRTGALDTEIPDLYVNPRLDHENPWFDMATNWEFRVSIPAHCFLFDARLFREHGIRFDVTLPNHEDWDCWLHILAQQPRVTFIDQKLAVYRVNPGSMATDLRLMRRGFLAAVRKQRNIWKDHPERRAALRMMEREVRRAYRSVSPFARLAARVPRLRRVRRRIG